MLVKLADIFVNPKGHRAVWKENEYYEYLRLSIKERGVLMPILVRPIDKGYEIIKGLHRYHAALDVGLVEIPVHIIEATDVEVEEIQVITSVHRYDPTPRQYNLALLRLASHKPYLTLTDLAKRLTKGPEWIRQNLYLYTLCEEGFNLVNIGKIVLLNGHLLSLLPQAEQVKYLMDAQTMHPDTFSETVHARIKQIREERRKSFRGQIQAKVCIAHVNREFFENGKSDGTETEFVYEDDPRVESLKGCNTLEEVRVVLREPPKVDYYWEVTSVQFKDRVIV